MNACVIGAGTMGSGIAAHLANLGFEVTLLDMTRESAEACLERAKKVKPAHFYGPESLERINLGGIDQDLEMVRNADWVCEAIIEDIEAKRSLYHQIEKLLKPDAMMTTNTSSLPLSQLCEGLPEHFRQRFIGTHFFNPPRYLKLLELIPTADTTHEQLVKARKFLEEQVSRRVVIAKDTPGFIANRFGMWSMFHAVHTAEKLGLAIEQVDAICGPFLGRPRSAAFRLNDLVGLDVMAFIAGIMSDRCPEDPHRDALKHPKSLDFLMEKGWIGQKSGQGYYRKEGKELLSFDLVTHAYRNQTEVDIPSLKEHAKKPIGERIRLTLQARDEAGEFLRHHLIPVLQYAEYLREEVCHSVQDFDRVMMWGFGWDVGPFALIDAIGAEHLGMDVKPYFEGDLMRAFDGRMLDIVKEPEYRTITDYPVVESGEGFNVRDLGDGVLALASTSKMGVISPNMIAPMIEWLAPQNGPIVLTSEARSFSAGFNLQFFAEAIDAKDFDGIDQALKLFQDLTMRLSQKRVVSAVFGHCLGGGWEIAAACPQMAALAESQIGLPEARVGLIPGGAGTCRMRLRWQTSAADMVHGCIQLTQGAVSSSAADAKRMRLMRNSDVIIHHPDRLITDARELAKNVEVKPQPVWLEVDGPVGGMIDREQQQLISKGELTQHDEFIGNRIKQVWTKCSSFEEALVKERAEFIELCHNALSLARIKHMLESGKPLRN